jgi:hypothetical protein
MSALAGIVKEAQGQMLVEQGRAVASGVGDLVGGAVEQLSGVASIFSGGAGPQEEEKTGLGGIAGLLSEAQKRMLIEQGKQIASGVGGLVGGAAEQLVGAGSAVFGGLQGQGPAAEAAQAQGPAAKMLPVWNSILANVEAAISLLDQKSPDPEAALRLLQAAAAEGDQLTSLVDELPRQQATGELLYAVYGATGTLDSSVLMLQPHAGVLRPLLEVASDLEDVAVSMQSTASEFPELQQKEAAPEEEAPAEAPEDGEASTAHGWPYSGAAYEPWRFVGGGLYFDYFSKPKSAKKAAAAKKLSAGQHWCKAIEYVQSSAGSLKQGLIPLLALAALRQAGAEVRQVKDLVEGGSLVWGKVGGTAGRIESLVTQLEPHVGAPQPLAEIIRRLRRTAADMRKDTPKIAALG